MSTKVWKHFQKINSGPLTSATSPLDCYQNERLRGESRIENHSHMRRRRIRYTTTMVLWKWQVSILF